MRTSHLICHECHCLSDPSITFKSIDTVVNADEVEHYPTEFLMSLDLPGLLKKGAPVILGSLEEQKMMQPLKM